MKLIKSGSIPLDVYGQVESVALYRSNDLKDIYIRCDTYDGAFIEIQWSVDDTYQNANWDSIVIVEQQKGATTTSPL